MWRTFHLIYGSMYLLLLLHQSQSNPSERTDSEDVDDDPLLIDFKRRLQDLRAQKKDIHRKNEKLKSDQQNCQTSVEMEEVIRLNIGGEVMMTTRATLGRVPASTLAKIFINRWDDRLDRSNDGEIVLDFQPTLFRHLLEQLRRLKATDLPHFVPPHSASPRTARMFNMMVQQLGLNLKQSPSNPMVTMNIGGNHEFTRQNTLAPTNSSELRSYFVTKRSPKGSQESNLFIDADPSLFQDLLKHLRERPMKNSFYPAKLPVKNLQAFNRMLKTLKLNPSTSPSPTRWHRYAQTVAFGLQKPHGLFVDEDQLVYIADLWNNRVLAWKVGANRGDVVAGGTGKGALLNQLSGPSGVIVDRTTNTILISDQANLRVVRWPRRVHLNSSSAEFKGEIVADNIECRGLTIDDQGTLYVSDWKKDEVRRYDKGGDKRGKLIAGGHGTGVGLHQLNHPTYLFVDAQSNLYISDTRNHRVVKWMKGATEGIIVAGGYGQGANMTQLSHPTGLWVDDIGNLYVADSWNHRVMLWEKDAKQGTVIAGGNGEGSKADQLSLPEGLSFDRDGHLYIADRQNNRVQRFLLIGK